MSEYDDTSTASERGWIYAVLGAIAVVLVVIGLFAYTGQKKDAKAEANADKLIAVFRAAGYRPPAKNTIVGVLGSDGGATCNDPTAALTKSIFRGMLYNGAAGPGARPIIADSQVARGQLAVIKIYCPEELEGFQDFIDGLDFDNNSVKN